jgi:L-ascorbate 6-phosphate lactonase
MKRLTMKSIQAHHVAPGTSTLWWLGQAGFILKTPGGKIAVLDPYLSNSCKAIGEQNNFLLDRQTPPPMTAKEMVGVDLYLLTHTHQDHLDPETIGPYRAAGGRGQFIAPPEAVEKLRSLTVPEKEITMVWPNKSVTIGDLTVRATFAIPFGGDDLTHVGYLAFVQGGPTIYFTGDTSYDDILADAVAPHKPDVLVTVINGAFKNLGPADGARLAKKLNVRITIPCHHDLFFDNCQPPQMLHTSLKLHGMGDTYRLLEHGTPFDLSVT